MLPAPSVTVGRRAFRARTSPGLFGSTSLVIDAVDKPRQQPFDRAVVAARLHRLLDDPVAAGARELHHRRPGLRQLDRVDLVALEVQDALVAQVERLLGERRSWNAARGTRASRRA